MEAPDDTTSTADEHKEEERKEGDPPGDIAVEPAAPPSPGGAGRGPEADGGPPKAARGDEVLCVCCNYGTVARCVDCVCGFEQLNYNEENLIYKNVVRLALLVACAFYAYETYGVVEKRFQVYAHAPYWVRYSHIFAEALGDGAKRRQPSAERAGAFDPAGVSNLIDKLYGDSYSKEDLALLKQSHCNASVVLESANGKRDTDDCGIDAPVYKRGCRAGYYEPRGAARGPNPHLDTAAPCPDGFFCLADVTCFIACPLGSSCVASAAVEDGGTCKYWKHVEKGAESHAVTYYNATLQRYVHGDVCPGASHVALCAAGYSCPSPAGRDKGDSSSLVPRAIVPEKGSTLRERSERSSLVQELAETRGK